MLSNPDDFVFINQKVRNVVLLNYHENLLSRGAFIFTILLISRQSCYRIANEYNRPLKNATKKRSL